MKNQFVTLLLSAVIFTTSPLFAMDKPDVDAEGRGVLCKLSTEILVKVINDLPIEDLMAVSATSKTMHSFCSDSTFWQKIANKEGIKINHNTQTNHDIHLAYIKAQIKYSFGLRFGLFREKSKNYPVKISWLRSWKTEPGVELNCGFLYCFSIGKQDFQMIMISSLENKNLLDTIDGDAYVTFTWKKALFPGQQDHFTASVKVCGNKTGIKDLSSSAYEKHINTSLLDRRAFFGCNIFNITKLEKKQP